MTDFNVNTRKTRLKQPLTALTQRAKNALKQLEFLKENGGWAALIHPHQMRPPRRSRAGLDLFNATLWTLVAIAFLVSILTLYNGVVDSTRTAALRSQLTRAVAIIERDHSSSGTYTGVTLLGFLNDEGFSKREFYRVGTGWAFKTPYDTAITIAPDDNNARKFVVTVNGLPPSACEAAVSVFSARSSGLDSVNIGGVDKSQSDLTELFVSDECAKTASTIVKLTF